MRKILFLSVFLFCLTHTVFSQAKFKVEVSVQLSGNTTLKQQVESYFTRALRSLGDVEIVESGDYWLDVLAMETHAKNGTKFGVALSYRLQKYGYCPTDKKVYLEYLGGGLTSTSSSDLREAIEDIITGLDTDAFELVRKKR